MAGYTKLFNSILASTIWRADDKTRIVWITLLAMADRHGVAEGSVPGLADLARVSIEDTEAALLELSSPDKYSRSKEFEGRRIEAIDGGWRIINHGKYREKMSADERREYNRQKQAEWRARQKMSTDVNHGDSQSALSVHTEAEATPEAEAKASPEPTSGASLEEMAERDRNNRLPTKETAIRIAKLFNRRLTTEWDEKEIRVYRKLKIEGGDLDVVERYYRQSGSKYLRRDLGTFLNNFNGEVDRARAWVAAGSKREGTNGTRAGEYEEQIDIEKFTFRP